MNDIHDIKPMIAIGFDLTFLIYIAIAILILIVIISLIIFFKKRKKFKNTQIIQLSPQELAYKLLDEISDIDSIDKKEFYFKLSAIFRGYISKRFGIEALEMTTEELLPKILELKLLSELKINIKEWLFSLDAVKFAGFSYEKIQMQNDLNYVRYFVKKTTLEPEIDKIK